MARHQLEGSNGLIEHRRILRTDVKAIEGKVNPAQNELFCLRRWRRWRWWRLTDPH